MGVDFRLLLNPVAHVDEIVQISGILLGCSKKLDINKNSDDEYYSVSVPEAQIHAPNLESSSFKNIENKPITTNRFNSMLMLFFKNELGHDFELFLHLDINSKGQKLISHRSTPVNIALALRLLSIFGGSLQYKDSDNKADVIIKKGTYKDFFSDDDDDGYVQRHVFINNITPLTAFEIIDANKLASYQIEDKELSEYVAPFAELYAKKLDKELNPKNEKTTNKMKI